MKQLVKIIVMLSVLVSLTGCASYLSYEASKNEIKKNRIYASGDEKAIKAFAVDGGAGVAINVNALDALTEHPIRQLGAAILDAGLVYGAKVLVDKYEEDNSNKDKTVVIQNSGDNNNINVNTGDANSNENNKDSKNDNSSGE